MAFVLKADSVRWMPQQVKFRLSKQGGQYKTVYFSGGDHSEQHPTLIKDADTLDFGFFKKLVKAPKPLNTTIKMKKNLTFLQNSGYWMMKQPYLKCPLLAN